MAVMRASWVPAVFAIAALGSLGGTATTAAAAAPSVEAESVSHVTATDATVEAKIDPGGLEAEYQFRVVASPCYANPLNCELVSDPLVPTPPAKIGAASGSQSVSLELNGAGLVLEPGREYHYAVFATNSDGTGSGPDQTFATGIPPSIEAESVSNVTATGATLEADVNLHEAPAGVYYQFQLATDSTEYASEILCPPTPQPGYSGCIGPQAPGALPIGFLPGNTMQPSATLRASLDLAGVGVTLQPGTTYHFRVLAARAVQTEDTIEWEPPTVYGVDQTFTTQSAGTTPFLPAGFSQAASRNWPDIEALSVLGCGTARNRALVSYRRSGGLGGGSVHLVVTQDGDARATTRSGMRRTSLGRRIRARLARALRRANFGSLKPVYEPASPPADAFTYTITHACHTVRAVDTAVPPRLQALIGILDQIVTKLSS